MARRASPSLMRARDVIGAAWQAPPAAQGPLAPSAALPASGAAPKPATLLATLAAQVHSVAGLPEGEARLRSLLEAVFAAGQQSLPVSGQFRLLREAVARTGLLQPPQRFVFHRLACAEIRRLALAEEEKADLIANLAIQIHKLPPWVTPQEPPQREFGPAFLSVARAADPGQPQPPLFAGGLSPAEKMACAVALAEHCTESPFITPATLSARREAFEECCALALDVPVERRFNPLMALVTQLNCLPSLRPEPHLLEGQSRSMREAGVAKILAAAAALQARQRAQLVGRVAIQIKQPVFGQAEILPAMRQQIRADLEAHPLRDVYAVHLNRFLSEWEKDPV